jgi:flagellar hook-associated protein 1 FlgK
MTSSFSGIDTLSRSLYNQSLVQNTIANNLSKTYRDADGYVMVSRERDDFSAAPTLSIYTGSGFATVGQGQQLQQITRMRSFYLDYQIQQQSMTLGREEVTSNYLKQVSSVLNSSTGTLNSQLTTLATDFTNLSADPTNLTLRNAVVTDGTTFATMARDEYSQLENIQNTLNGQVSETVTNINSMLQQLNTINKQLLATPNGQSDSLLDARDYTLDTLSRLVNFNVSYGTNGTVSVSMNGLSLVDASGAAVLGTDTIDPHNPPFSDVSYQSSQGTQLDITDQIQGGQLAGLLQSRDVTVEGIKNDLDHYVSSVMTVTNMLHRSGYGSDGTTTGTNFFTGTSARDISVNASILTDSNRVLVAASSRYGDTTNGQIAQFLGDLPNLLTNNDIQSYRNIDSNFPANTTIDPTQALNSATVTALNIVGSNSTDFATTPAAAGSFTVNSATVTYTAGESIYNILDAINSADPTVHAVFSYTDQKIYMLSSKAISVKDVTGNFTGFTSVRNFLSSTIRMNNGLSPSDILINQTGAMNNAQNTQAFKITPSVSGSFMINGIEVDWKNTMSLMGPTNSIQSAILTATGGTVSVAWNTATQQLSLYSTSPITITDLTGNFTTFAGLNGNTQLGNMGSGLAAEATDSYNSSLAVTNASQASLDQLNNAQADIAAVSFSGSSDSSSSSSTTTETEAGVPAANEEADSVKSMVAYNAALQAMAIQEKMLDDLIAIVSGSSSGTSISLSQNS